MNLATVTEVSKLLPYLTAQEKEQLDNLLLRKPFTEWQPLPWQIPVLADTSPVILLTGSAGGGKSRCGGELIHQYMSNSRHATGLLLRKAREFASKSIVPFMRQTVIGRNPQVTFKKSDSLFAYSNGGQLYWGGMKDDSQREALRSIGQDGALDIVLMEEGNAFTEDDYNELLGRMRGKARDYTQIIIMTNPDAPNHWINRRLIIGGEAKVYYSGALDNIYNPPEYVERLKMLTGMLYQRLVLGKWVQAEGVIYDNFEPQYNVTDEAEYNPALPVWWGVDDGYAQGAGVGTESYHPRVFILAQPTAIGGLHIFAEYVKTTELSEKSVHEVLAWPYPRPERVYIDSSAAELRGRIWSMSIQTISATHPVSEGIKNVRRLICDGQGMRLLKIHPRCTYLISELQSYHYSPNFSGVQAGEPKPEKINDHAVDAVRYLAFGLRYSY